MTDIQKYETSAEFRKVLDAFDNGHDQIQMQYFIVGQGLTDYGKWKQACIETRTRYAALKQIGFDTLKLQAEIKILEAEIAEQKQLDSPKSKARARRRKAGSKI
jgi:hypothetical protein